MDMEKKKSWIWSRQFGKFLAPIRSQGKKQKLINIVVQEIEKMGQCQAKFLKSEFQDFTWQGTREFLNQLRDKGVLLRKGKDFPCRWLYLFHPEFLWLVEETAKNLEYFEYKMTTPKEVRFESLWERSEAKKANYCSKYWADILAPTRSHKAKAEFLSDIIFQIFSVEKFYIGDYKEKTNDWEDLSMSYNVINRFLNNLRERDILIRGREGDWGKYFYTFNFQFPRVINLMNNEKIEGMVRHVPRELVFDSE